MNVAELMGKIERAFLPNYALFGVLFTLDKLYNA